LSSGPVSYVELSLGRLFRARRLVEDECVCVAEHRRTAELSHERDDVRGLAAALHRVAEADDLVDRVALEVGEHRFERDRVAVDVRDQRGADRLRLRRDRAARHPPHVVHFEPPFFRFGGRRFHSSRRLLSPAAIIASAMATE
jgi:hypothetical protein